MATKDRRIDGAVLQSGRIYQAGDEAALALVLPPHDIERLAAKGVLTGDWSSQSSSSEQPTAPAEAAADESETESEFPAEPDPSVALESSDVPAEPSPTPAKPSAKGPAKPLTKKRK